MRVNLTSVVFLILVTSTLSSCGGNAIEDMRSVETFTLYSVLGEPAPPETALPNTGEWVHGFPVLGKVDISNAEAKKSIVDALHQGIPKTNSPQPKCFNPRHGIRIKRYGITTDHLICFECGQIRSFGPLSVYPLVSATDGTPQKILNSHLRKAGITLDPSMKGDI
jgi:hypothetical protein